MSNETKPCDHCGGNGGEPLHECPHHGRVCRCCKFCTNRCAMGAKERI